MQLGNLYGNTQTVFEGGISAHIIHLTQLQGAEGNLAVGHILDDRWREEVAKPGLYWSVYGMIFDVTKL